jgi:hypothetical protein
MPREGGLSTADLRLSTTGDDLQHNSQPGINEIYLRVLCVSIQLFIVSLTVCWPGAKSSKLLLLPVCENCS